MRRNSPRFLSLTSLFVIQTSLPASASIITFNNRADFLAAAGPTSLIDFSGIAPSGFLVTYDSALIQSGVAFTGLTGDASSPIVHHVVDPGFFPAYDRGGLPASLVGPLNPANGPDPRIQVEAPAGTPFYAVGFDLYSVQAGDGFPYAATDTVVIHVGAQSYSVPTVAINFGDGLVFFGFVSTEAITSLTIETSSDLNANTSIGRFAFSTNAPSTVPEPSSFTMLMMSLLGVSVSLKARRRV